MTPQNYFFFNFIQLVRHPRTELFHLSNLLQIPNDRTMVDIEFFGKFLCSCKWISFIDDSQLLLSTSSGRPLHSHSGPNCRTGRARGVQTPTGMGLWGRLFKWEPREKTFPVLGFQKRMVIHSRKPAARVPSPVFSQKL